MCTDEVLSCNLGRTFVQQHRNFEPVTLTNVTPEIGLQPVPAMWMVVLLRTRTRCYDSTCRMISFMLCF